MNKPDARLLAAIGLLGVGGTVADIGTDHGYLAAYLVQTGAAKHVIAADVSKKCLERAKINTCAYEQVETRLSDGFASLSEGEADAAVIAGIGGNTIRDIIDAGTKNVPTLVIQPMGYADEVRRALSRAGYGITDERLIRDGRRYYFLMRAELGKARPLSEEEILFGPCLLERRDPMLLSYIERELARFKKQQALTDELNEIIQKYEEVREKWFAR